MLVAALGWTDRFASMIGGDTLNARKPHAAPLQEAVRQAGRGTAVLVGNSITDIETAKAVQLPCIAVTYGYRDRPAEKLGAPALIDRFDQLLPTPERLSARQVWSVI